MDQDVRQDTRACAAVIIGSGSDAFDTPNLNVALADGTRSEALPIESPRTNLFINGQIDYALTLDQTLRVGYNLSRFTNHNLGVGGFDQIERPYSTDNTTQNVRIQHFGPVRHAGNLGPRFG